MCLCDEDNKWLNIKQSESAQRLRSLQLEPSLRLHLLQSSLISNLSQDQPAAPILKHRQLSDHHRDHPLRSQRQLAVLQQLYRHLAVLGLGRVLHKDDDPRPAGHQVHRSSHSLHHLAGNDPVSDVTTLRDLEGAQHGDIEMASADDGERLRR